MIAKSMQDLVQASKGNFAAVGAGKSNMLGPIGATGAAGPSVSLVPQSNAYAEALANRTSFSPSAASIRTAALPSQAAGVASGGLQGNLNASAMAVTPASQLPATRLYADILASSMRSPAGLSSKGKYGGFYNAGDLEAAIRGSATGIKSLAPQLRSAADVYYTELDKAYSEAGKEPYRYFSAAGHTAQMPSVRPDYQYGPNSYVSKIVNPSREYANTLADWYSKSASPAQEYYQTAQQIETTPLSQLAERIAVSQYGMNPNLAAGKFAGLDSEYFKQQRDQQYISQYGVPYEQWTAEQTKAQKDYAALTKSQQEQYKSMVEQSTGFSSDRLKTSTNMTPAQMYTAVSQTYDYGGKQVTGQDFINQANAYIANGDDQAAVDLIGELSSIPGSDALRRLMNVLLNFSLGKPAAIASSTETSTGLSYP